MLPILQIGPLAIQAPGLALILSLWLGLILAERYAARRGVAPAQLYNLVFYSLLAALVAARLSYVLQYPQAFANSPLSVLSPNPALLDVWGALAGGLLASLIYAQRAGLTLWPTLDALTPFLAVIAIGLGLTHIASGAAFGAPSDLPWAVTLWGAARHPTQIYETLAAALILAALWPGRAIFAAWPSGQYFLAFVSASAGARLFLEAFRGDSQLLPGGLRLAQVMAWLILAAALWAIRRRSNLSSAPASKDIETISAS